MNQEMVRGMKIPKALCWVGRTPEDMAGTCADSLKLGRARTCPSCHILRSLACTTEIGTDQVSRHLDNTTRKAPLSH